MPIGWLSILTDLRQEAAGVLEMILMETELTDALVSRVFGDDDNSAIHAFTGILLCLRSGVEERERSNKIINTIDLILELTFLKSRHYDASFNHYLNCLSGEAMPDEPLVFDFCKPRRSEQEEKLRAAIRDPAVSGEDIKQMIDKQWPDNNETETSEEEDPAFDRKVRLMTRLITVPSEHPLWETIDGALPSDLK